LLTEKSDLNYIDKDFLSILRSKTMSFMNIFIYIFVSFLILFSSVSAKNKEKTKKIETVSEEDGYTVNFNNIAITEYIKFVGKICNVNFMFNETDLQFSVSVISDKPTSNSDLMTTLVQIFRIHGLSILEQDNNLVIHKTPGVKQFGTITTGENDISVKTPIVTRIFRIENVSADNLAATITPMISTGAIVELFAETKQLIVTDVTANVEKIAEFIQIIDSPYSPLQIELYSITYGSATELIKLTQQIMQPIAGANNLTFVPQESSGTVYIVSTPKLIKKTIDVLKSLDKKIKRTNRRLTNTNIFIYKTKQSPTFVSESLDKIVQGLIDSGYNEDGLIEMIKDMRPIPSTSSIVFTGTPTEIAQLKEILPSIDTAPSAKIEKTFFIYKAENKRARDLAASIRKLSKNFDKMGISNPQLLSAIENFRVIEKTNALVFSCDQKTFTKIKELLVNLDTTASKALQEDSFFNYPIVNISQDQMISTLHQISEHLKEANSPDKELINTLETVKAIPNTNTIIITGNPTSLSKIKNILKTIDIPKSKVSSDSFFLYQPLYLSEKQLEKYFNQISSHLSKSDVKDNELIQALKSATWLSDSNSFSINGSKNALDQIKTMVKNYDTASELKKLNSSSNYFLYKLKYISGKDIENDLDNFSKKLKSQGVKQPALLDVIENIKWVKETNSILLTGEPSAFCNL